ncbi:cytochrome P450 [Lentinula aciculospora]|uniref:Cytochrome P450 n=1 Tax=Lentinula aciculospora TaxID=153920 RepID=A0A9W9DFI3_9AGAR|nr:cytochrome P450 [Lentinula aciculospora]
MFSNIPPGISFIIKSIPQLILPPIIAFATVLIDRSYVHTNVLSGWRVSLLCIVSYPLALTISVAYSAIVKRIVAARMGAVLLPEPPFLEDPTPGGLLFLYGMIKESRDGYVGDGLKNRLRSTGPTFNMRIFFQDRLVTSEPNHIKALLATQFEDFVKGQDTLTTMNSLLGTGVFANDGILWRFHRSITRPFFSRDRITHFDIFDRHTDEAIGKMKTRFKEGYAADFQDVVSRFTLDSATEFLFGHDIGTLSDPLPYPFFHSSHSVSNTSNTPFEQTFSARFSRSFNEAQTSTAVRVRFGDMWPLRELWQDIPKEKMKLVHGFLDPIIRQGVQRSRLAKESTAIIDTEKEDETVLDHLIQHTDDPIILRDEIMNLAVAGRDTTASLLTFTVYMLSQHSDVLNKLRSEILSIVGPDRRPTYDDFREMKYLRAVLNETLRLYPPVPFNMRHLIVNCSSCLLLIYTLGNRINTRLCHPSNRVTSHSSYQRGPGWHTTNSNTSLRFAYTHNDQRCIYSVFVMQRRTDLWGPDALKFDPDRFLDERVQKYLIPNPFIFCPFNAGPRICIGQQFAYNESSFFLVRLLQNFSSIEISEESQPPDSRPSASWKKEGGIKATEKVKLKTHLTMYVAEGLWLKMGESSEAVEDI